MCHSSYLKAEASKKHQNKQVATRLPEPHASNLGVLAQRNEFKIVFE
jgi:hypothetical protein